MTTQIHPEDSAPSSAEHGSSVNNITIDLGGATLVVVAVLTILIGACGVVIGLDISERERMSFEFARLDRQYRMTELKLDDWTVVAHRAGLQLPGDYTRGPQGNLDQQSFKPKQVK